MILSVGEILTDMIGVDSNYKMYVGGAPFNVAVSVVRSGGECTFIGKVGNDIAGNFIKKEVKKFGIIDKIITDDFHNTTRAVVSLRNGERSFSFVRFNTADYQLNLSEITNIESSNIIHMGTLMLSEEIGRNFADKLIVKIKDNGKMLSMDANFRDDLFATKEERNKIMLPYLLKSDILKLSFDELEEITHEKDIYVAVKKLGFNGILFITDGEKGSYAFMNGKSYFAPTKKVKPKDTTGAGDAYFGTVLAEIDKCIINKRNIENSLLEIITKANISGSNAVLHEGAV